jgi:hypothetical protein
LLDTEHKRKRDENDTKICGLTNLKVDFPFAELGRCRESRVGEKKDSYCGTGSMGCLLGLQEKVLSRWLDTGVLYSVLKSGVAWTADLTLEGQSRWVEYWAAQPALVRVSRYTLVGSRVEEQNL